MKYLESIVSGIIGAVIVIMIALFLPFIALGILIAGLTGKVSFKKNDTGKIDICIDNKILHDMVSKGKDNE